MTKREMILEIIDGLNYGVRQEQVIQNRCKRSLSNIKQVYDYYLKNKDIAKNLSELKVFCINLLVTW